MSKIDIRKIDQVSDDNVSFQKIKKKKTENTTTDTKRTKRDK